jgi:hypothetical protein
VRLPFQPKAWKQEGLVQIFPIPVELQGLPAVPGFVAVQLVRLAFVPCLSPVYIAL